MIALLVAATSLTLCGSLLGFSNSLWFCFLLDQFRLMFFLVAAALMAPSLILRKLDLALVNLAILVINFCGMQGWIPYCSTHSESISADGKHLHILEMNVEYTNNDYEKAITLIKNEKPDLVVIEELTNIWLAHLQTALKAYPYRVIATEDTPYGNGIFSKVPFQKTNCFKLGPRHHPTLKADFVLNDTPMSIIHTHLPGPVSPRSFPMHKMEANEVENIIATCRNNAILCGDMNSSSWCYPLRGIAEKGSLKDTRSGRGLQPSWPSKKRFPHFPILAIDHCFVRGNIKTIDRRTGPFIGSDHLPVIIDLSIPKKER